VVDDRVGGYMDNGMDDWMDIDEAEEDIENRNKLV
jgi:hypothetical protein